VAFEQAAIKVDKEQEFEELKTGINRVFAPGAVERYLKQLASAGIRIRDFDSVLAKNVLERAGALVGKRARDLYSALTVTDQAQIKEFYLFKIEEVGPELRAKFQKLYQYY
jgi:hypothetical protein